MRHCALVAVEALAQTRGKPCTCCLANINGKCQSFVSLEPRPVFKQRIPSPRVTSFRCRKMVLLYGGKDMVLRPQSVLTQLFTVSDQLFQIAGGRSARDGCCIGSRCLPFINAHFAVADDITALVLTSRQVAPRAGSLPRAFDFLSMASLASGSFVWLERWIEGGDWDSRYRSFGS